MYDAIVVGARVAGATTAMLLARRGHRVLLVDRSTFPSDIMSTHYIWPSGLARLKRWDVLERVIATGCPELDISRLDLGELQLRGAVPPVEGVSGGYCPRRYKLDTILVEEAVRAGAELRDGFTVDEVTMDGSRVTGIRGRGREATATETARVVVGAEGQHSRVAQAVGAPRYNEKPAQACYYYSYFSGIPDEGAVLSPRDGRVIVRLPTNDGLTCIGVGWTNAEFPAYRADVERNFLETLRLTPDLADHVASGHREERFIGTADLPNFFRKPYGPGWSLVGDAGFHKDPVIGHGITDAFLDAELLAEALDAALSGRVPYEEALGGYEQRRNDRAMAHYEMTCDLARLAPPPPDVQQLFGALRDNRADTDQYWGVLDGSVPVQQFFAPANVERIMGQAAMAQPATA
jgi:flavin-dependent dehydrogenase